MSELGYFVVSYDLADNRERHHTSTLLEGYGFRRQKSVFECRLTRSQHEKLRRELAQLELESGFVMIYRITPNTQPLGIGQVPPFPDDDWAYIV